MKRRISIALALLALGTSREGLAQEVSTRVEAARWKLEKVGSREVWGPRTTRERVELLRPLVAEVPTSEEPIQALAHALVAQGDVAGAEAAYRKWAGAHPDPAEGSERLAEWLVDRRQAKEALAAFEEAAGRREGASRAAVYTRMLAVADRLRPEGVDRLRLHEARFAADPQERSHARALLAELSARKGVDAALTRLETMASAEPRAWVSEKVSLLEEASRLEDARALLEAEWSRRRDLESARELGAFLRRIDAYEERAGELVEGWSARALGDDDLELAAHFRQLYPYDTPLRDLPGLTDLVRALAARWEGEGPAELARLGALWAEAQEPGEALRAYLAALEASRGEAGEAGARRALVAAALELEDPGDALRPPGAVATRAYALDPHPGVVSGFASLFWSGANPSENAAKVSENLAADAAASRVDAWLAREWREAPGDPDLVPLLKRFVSRLERRDLHRRGADVWLKFAEQTKDPGLAAGHRLEALKVLQRSDSATQGGVRASLERWARKVLEAAEAAGLEDIAKEAFGILEWSLKARKDQAGVIALYRRELDKGEPDADTLERFLGLLTSYRLYGELDAVYDRALGAFPERTWFDRAARWYVRQKRHDAFADVSRRAVRELAASELATYLGRRTRLARSGRGAGRDRALYLELYRSAHQRFPHDLRFVDALLRYHGYFKQVAEVEDLAFRYAARRADLADRVWTRRMATGGLGGTVKALAAARSSSRAASVLLARAHEWLSRFEEASPIWQQLAAEIPDEQAVLEAAARSLRSLGEPMRAVAQYQKLATQRPGDRQWPTLVGEMRIEGGDLEGAKEAWREIGRATPGDAEGWRSAATVLWDYYLFDDAVAALTEGRRVLGEPRAFGTEMEALHEGRGAWEQAAEEAVATLVHRGGSDWPMLQRLGVLGRRGHQETIQSALEEAVRASPGRAEPLRAMLAVFDEWGREWSEIHPVLRTLVPVLEARQPLHVVLSRARSQDDEDLEGLTLERLATVLGREPRALLELLSFRGRTGDSAAVSALAREVHAGAEALPNTLRGRAVRLFQRLGQALWENDQREAALAEWRAGVARARGDGARQQRMALARRLVEFGRPEEARRELEELLKNDPTDTDAVFELAEVSLRQGRGEDLVPLYAAAEKRLAEAEGLSVASRKARRFTLRRRLVADLHRAGRVAELGPRLAELVLAERGDEGLARDAWRLARVSGQMPALLGPLERYAKESTKDYRAHRLLAWMAEYSGDLAAAATHLGRAVAEEPQRVDLRRPRLELLLRQGAFEGAREELAALEARSPEGPVDFAEDRARLERLAGRPVAAREALERLRPGSLAGEEDARRLERYAQALWRTGEERHAWEAFRELFDTLERDGPLIWSPSWGDAERWVEWTRVVHGPAEAFRRATRRTSRLRLKGGDGYPARVRRWTADWLQSQRDSTLLVATRDNGPASDRRGLLGVLEEAGHKTFDRPEAAYERTGFEELLLDYLRDQDDMDDLWDHLASAGRYDELDGTLTAALGSGKAGAQARKAVRLAELRRARNEPERELAALRAAPNSRGPTWYLSDHHRRRMLDLVLDLEGEEALERELAGRGLWGVNEALRRERPQLAAKLLEEGFGPDGVVSTTLRWKRDAHTRIASSFDLPPAGVDASFDGLLDRRPVGPRLASPPSPDGAVLGAEYFPVAARYARWLLDRGRREEAAGYASALAEGRPRDPGSELETAALLHDLGDAAAARRRLEAARARKPGDWSLEERALRMLHTWGERDLALERLKAWSGPKALTRGWWQDLLRIGDELGEEATIVAWLEQELAVAGPEVSVDLLREVLAGCEEHLDAAGRLRVHRALLASWRSDGARAELLARRPGAPSDFRLEAFEAAVAAFQAAPTRVRLEYQRRMAAAATHADDGDRARAALKQVALLADQLEKQGEAAPDLRLERAERRYALGDGTEAQALLEDYLGPEDEAGQARERWAAVHRVLELSGRSAEAAALRRRYYRARERVGGGRSREVLAGLIREALVAGDTSEATAIGARLAARDPDDSEALAWLGRTLAGAGLYAEGIDHLRRARRVRPSDLELGLSLAEAQLGAGETLGAGLATLAGVVRDRRASDELRARAMAAMRRAAPSEEDLKAHWRPALPDATARAERLWGEAQAAAGRGDFGRAAEQFRKAGEADPVETSAWRELLRLLQRPEGGNADEAAGVLRELQRRESVQLSRSSRFTGHRLFWARARAGAGAGNLELLRTTEELGDLREDVESDPAQRAWEAILGGAGENGSQEFYPEVHQHHGVEDMGLGLPGWGGDSGVDADPFAGPAPPGSLHARAAALAEGLPVHGFLMAVARAHQAAGNHDEAISALVVAGALAASDAERDEVEATRRAVDEAAAKAAARREKRLVLASE